MSSEPDAHRLPRPPRLGVSGLRSAYPGTDQPALDGVDLSVAAGEVVAVLGPSGCGKTTLLRAIAGLQPVTAGRIEVDGHDLAAVPPHQRGVGLMFQDYALFPHRDVSGNVGFALRMRGDAPAARTARVAEVLELVGLRGFERRAVSTLSGGEQQRVALARALAPSPSLLMLDEPLGSLDRVLRERLVVELGHLFGDLGLTVLLVTHDQGEALGLADRVVVMDRGRVAQQGTPSQVWAQPASPFVAAFLGFANRFPVQVRAGRADAPWGTVDVGRVGSLDGGSDDGPATLLVRPEAVGLHVAGTPAGPRAWSAAGRVVDARFEGERWRVRVAIDGPGVSRTGAGPVVEALVEATAPAGGAIAGRDLAAGMPVRIEIDPAGVQLLGPDDGRVTPP